MNNNSELFLSEGVSAKHQVMAPTPYLAITETKLRPFVMSKLYPVKMYAWNIDIWLKSPKFYNRQKSINKINQSINDFFRNVYPTYSYNNELHHKLYEMMLENIKEQELMWFTKYIMTRHEYAEFD